MKTIAIEDVIEADIETVWECWTEPKHITKWAFASDDWEAPYAENDVQDGGRFLTRMGAKDGSTGFDFTGTHTTVEPLKRIDSVMDDGRTMSVQFESLEDGSTKLLEEFEMESENSEKLQREGWQAILDNFKKHVENL